MRLLISPTLSNRFLISDGDIPIFCAEASIANTVKARRSNSGSLLCNSSRSSILYKILYLYLLTPTSNHNAFWKRSYERVLYIFWLLHQTTTSPLPRCSPNCCISFDSYIKPQRFSYIAPSSRVVYLLTPTSNHNMSNGGITICQLYIFWLLHQTTTHSCTDSWLQGCISFDSYIKPQPLGYSISKGSVVYLLTPTSNHN